MSIDSDLRDLNPWWKSPNEINKEEELIEFEQSLIKYDPRIRRRFDYNTDVVYSLRGPRQVGKTTLIKLQIREFLKKGISPWNIMYFTFDLENSPKAVAEVIKKYLNLTKQQRVKKRCYIFLDEVSYVKDWQRGIKWLWDRGFLKNCTVVATGSHSLDIKFATERLPGRRGKTQDAYDKIMLPMKFSEYVSQLDKSLGIEITKRGLLNSESRKNIFKKLTKGEVDKNFGELVSYLNELNLHLENYMITGGIPKVVNEFRKSNDIKQGIYTDYLNAILGELSQFKKEETFFKQLIAGIIKNISWPVSWRTIWKETDIGNVTTAIEYMLALRDTFIITLFNQYDSKRKNSHLAGEKKIHFHDPFFLHILNIWNQSGNPFKNTISYVGEATNQGHIVEGIVGDHLIRLAFALSENKQLFDYTNHVFTWKYEKDKEVDYVLNDRDKIEIPIEVKYKSSISKKNDLNGIYNFQKVTSTKNGIVVSKDYMDTTKEYVIVPASMFLLLI